MSNKVAYGKLSKSLLVKEIEDTLQGGESVFVTQFAGVKTNAIFDLRKRLRKSQTQFLVIKNSLGRRVLGSGSFKGLSEYVDGQCGIAVTTDDAAQVSKVFVTFAEENPNFKIGAAFLNGEIFTLEMVKQLASLPSREELLAKAFGSMKQPIQGFVGVLNQLVTGVVNVLDQIRRSKEQQ